MLQPHESLHYTKKKLLDALESREITNINGDIVPESTSDVQFGEPVDRADLEKGWKRLQADIPVDNEGAGKKNINKSQTDTRTVMEAGLQDGYSIAFRFYKSTEDQNGGLDMDLDGEDPGWDVVMPTYEDEPEEQ